MEQTKEEKELTKIMEEHFYGAEYDETLELTDEDEQRMKHGYNISKDGADMYGC